MSQTIGRRTRILEFATFLTECSPEASAYGLCVSRNAENIAKDACKKEFEAFKQCVERFAIFPLHFEMNDCSFSEKAKNAKTMKIKRLKRVQRILSFYQNNFGFSKPFQVVVDGTFCMSALEKKINIREQIPKYLGDKTEIYTTACVLQELEVLGKAFYGGFFIAKQFDLVKCGHRPCVSATQCFLALGSDSCRKFFLGTQDKNLTAELHKIPHCPVLFVKYNTILLSKPPEFSVKTAEMEIQGRLKSQKVALPELKKKILGKELTETEGRKRKRRIKGPNPLSCKKKKKKKSVEVETEKKRRRKRRKKIDGDVPVSC